MAYVYLGSLATMSWTLTATGLNILRAAAVRKARKEDESAQDRRKWSAMYAFFIIKERVELLLAVVIQINRAMPNYI